METIIKLVSDAELKIWFMSGSGLGAVLLTIIAVTVVLSSTVKIPKFSDLFKVIRRSSTDMNSR